MTSDVSGRQESDRELARVRELAIAFALEEIDQDGLRELHGLLSGPRSAEMARASWEQLDGTVDLRVQLGGPAFAEAVKLKLADDGTFARAAQRRLGTRRPLDPVEAPPAPAVRWRRRLAWFLIPMVVAMAVSWWHMSTLPPAQVTAVIGAPSAGGATLAIGSPLEPSAPLVIPAGAAVAVAWRDGSAAVIAGPASAVVQPGGLSLVAGAAWCTAGPRGLLIGMPDRQVRLPAHGALAVETEESASAIAVPERAPTPPGGPAPGRVATAGGEFAWEPPRAIAAAGALPGSWWRLTARIERWNGDGRLTVSFEPGGAVALTPDGLLIGHDGTDPFAAVASVRPASTAGGVHFLHVRLHGVHAVLTVDGGEPRELILTATPTALRIDRRSAEGPDPELLVGPGRTPPLPLAGW